MGAEQSTAAAGPVAAAAAEPVSPAAQKDLPSALVIIGPSGVGKNTLINKLIHGEPDKFAHSISHTTRLPRPGEQHGKHYYFTTKEVFAKEVAEGKFLEYAEVHNNLYGTSINSVKTVLESGRVCVLDIDVQGARAVRKSPLRAIFVFVAPPSLEDLASRLAHRGSESIDQIKKRLENAKAEIERWVTANPASKTAEQIKQRLEVAQQEIESLNEKGLYDYLIINDNVDDCAAKLRAIADRALKGLDPEPGQAPLPEIPQPGSKSEEAPSPAPEAPAAPAAAPAAPAAAPTAAPAAPAAAAPAPSPVVAAVPPAAAPAAAAPAGMAKWQGKVALVTGASSGIGWATCEALALAGLKVVAVARRKERLEELQRHIHSLGIPPVHFLPVVCDITKDAEVATLPKIVAKRWPDSGIDVLVNNAGLSRSDGSLMEGNIASWVEMLSTNVLGTCMATRAVVQDMKRRQAYGHIINMVGLSGHRIPDGPQGGGFYCATKAAVKTITEGLRQEARGQGLSLRVSGISPGVVETEFFTVRAYGDADAAKRVTTQFKCLQPADVAQAVLYVLGAPEHAEVNDIVIRPTAQMI